MKKNGDLSAWEAFLYAHKGTPMDELMAMPECIGKTASSVERLRRMVKRFVEGATDETRAAQRLGKIADLLERSGIDADDVGKVEKVRLNEWQGFYKDSDSEPHTVDLEAASVILTPTWTEGPSWPVVQPSPPIRVKALPRRAQTNEREGLRVAVILPDAQIGFYRDLSGVLHPTHDEAALSVALQIVRAVNPDDIILLGDNLDFPEMSKYRTEKSFVLTTQPTIDRATLYVASLRANVSDDAEITWLEGNHDIRIGTYIKDNAAAAFGLRQGNVPVSWPVLSVPNLCRLDEFGVTFKSGYPANDVWLSDRLRAIHGFRAQKSSNAYPYLNEERCSTIYAHTHRREWAERTRQSRNGPRTIMASSPGCICRIDGAVPSVRGGVDVDGIPIVRYEDWQQGIAVVTYTPGDGPFFYEPVPIHHGLALWRGQRVNASCDVEGNALEDAA